MKVRFDFQGGRRTGKVVKHNTVTLWVDLVLGCNTHIYIKRHIIKHNVVFLDI
jgi:hypothetical protein